MLSDPAKHAAAISIVIPGEPCAQGRPRAVAYRNRGGNMRARVYDPAKSRNWKACAQAHMRDAMNGRPALVEPVRLEIAAYFTCPRSDWRKRQPRRERYKVTRPDLDNIVKAVKDAANGVLWLDDCQVCELHATKLIASQGAAPAVVVRVAALPTGAN